jgi:ABC-type glycerol-3-phosphate transport system substrate-binding protein
MRGGAVDAADRLQCCILLVVEEPMMTYRPVGLFVVLISCLLSACALGPEPTPPAHQPAMSLTPAAGGPQPTVITFGALESERRRFEPLIALIAQFNSANPDIDVRFVPLGSWMNLRQQNVDQLNRGVRALASFADTVLVTNPQPGVLVNPALADLIISNGQAGMWVSFGEWDMRGLAFPPEDSIVITTPPYHNHPPVVDALDFMAGYISEQTPHPEACWALLHALSADVALVQRLGMPVRNSVGESAEYTSTARPGAVAVFQTYRLALARPADQRFNDSTRSRLYYYWLIRALHEALQGKPLQVELERAQVRTADFMNCMRTGTDATNCAKQAAPDDPGWLTN